MFLLEVVIVAVFDPLFVTIKNMVLHTFDGGC